MSLILGVGPKLTPDEERVARAITSELLAHFVEGVTLTVLSERQARLIAISAVGRLRNAGELQGKGNPKG